MCTKSFPRETCQDMRHRIFCSLSVLNWFKFEKVCSFVQICIRRCPCSLDLQDGTVSVPLKSTEATDARKEADELHVRSRTNCTSILPLLKSTHIHLEKPTRFIFLHRSLLFVRSAPPRTAPHRHPALLSKKR